MGDCIKQLHAQNQLFETEIEATFAADNDKNGTTMSFPEREIIRSFYRAFKAFHKVGLLKKAFVDSGGAAEESIKTFVEICENAMEIYKRAQHSALLLTCLRPELLQGPNMNDAAFSTCDSSSSSECAGSGDEAMVESKSIECYERESTFPSHSAEVIKIKKEGLATIFAEWDNIEGLGEESKHAENDEENSIFVSEANKNAKSSVTKDKSVATVSRIRSLNNYSSKARRKDGVKRVSSPYWEKLYETLRKLNISATEKEKEISKNLISANKDLYFADGGTEEGWMAILDCVDKTPESDQM